MDENQQYQPAAPQQPAYDAQPVQQPVYDYQASPASQPVQPSYDAQPVQQPGYDYQAPQPAYQQPAYDYQQPTYPQPSAQAPVKGWSWGAFMFTMAWGIGNRAYLPFLCLLPIPIFNVIWLFVCGAKGTEWAWKSWQAKNGQDIATFQAVQDSWNRAGKIWFFIAILLVVLMTAATIIFGAAMFSVLDNMGYRLSF